MDDEDFELVPTRYWRPGKETFNRDIKATEGGYINQISLMKGRIEKNKSEVRKSLVIV